MYVLSMAALFKLRASEPRLPRPYKVPFYPVFRPWPWWVR
jgi:ethanolamine permease